MTRVVIVDDHPIVREGVKQILAAGSEFSVVGEAGDGDEALQVLRATPCDAVLLDISLPKRDGLQVLKQLRTEMPGKPVLVLSMYSEDEWAYQMLRNGAAGYLSKDTVADNLISALRKVVRGGRYVSALLSEKLAFGRMDVLDQPASQILSRREYQILVMLSSGKRISDIAGDLQLSVKTISTYRSRILEKLSLRNNAELMRYGIKQGIAEMPATEN